MRDTRIRDINFERKVLNGFDSIEMESEFFLDFKHIFGEMNGKQLRHVGVRGLETGKN